MYKYWIEAIVAQDLPSLVRLSEDGAQTVPLQKSQVSESCAKVVLCDVYDYSGATTWTESFLCDVAAYLGSTDILEWFLRYDGVALKGSVVAYAAKGGQVQTLTWLKDHGADMTDTFTYSMAAQRGRIAALDWLLENKVACNKEIILDRVICGDCDFDVLRWFVEQGRFPLLPNTMEYAMRYRKPIDQIHYLHSHGAPWGNLTCFEVVIRPGSFGTPRIIAEYRSELLAYMWRHHAPISHKNLNQSDMSLKEIFAWLENQDRLAAVHFKNAMGTVLCPGDDDDAVRNSLLDRILRPSASCDSCEFCKDMGTNIKGSVV